MGPAPAATATLPSRVEVVQELVASARDHLGMDLGYLSELTLDTQVVQTVDGDPRPFGLEPGARVPLEETYCLRLIQGRLPNLVPDTGKNPVTRDLPATSDSGLGSYVAVPVHTPRGRLHGTLCAVSRGPAQHLAARDVEFLRVLAVLLGRYVEGGPQPGTSQASRPARIRRTIETGEVAVVFQPIVSLASGRAVGVECLSRFPDGAPPPIWFREAERLGMGIDLERTAVRAATRQLRDIPPDMYLSVNASPEFIRSGALEDELGGCELSRLVVEVTEHAAVDNYGEVRAALEPMRQRGARLAIDDVGAGFASFRHIISLAPEVIKLDVSLTRDLPTDPARSALAETIGSFASRVGAQVVAEGLEQLTTVAALRDLGLDYGQGHVFARPGPLRLCVREFSVN